MSKIRIFLADDHKMVREGFCNTLGVEEDFEVIGQADDGLQAIKGVKELEPDVVIMDINMPNLNGIDAVKEIRKSNEHTKIIILTMLDNERFIIEALSAGINGYLFKDADLDELINAIRSIHDGEDYFNKDVVNRIINYHAQNKNIEHKEEIVEKPEEEPTEKAKEELEEEAEEEKKAGSIQVDSTQLSEREIEVIELVSKGYTSHEISQMLFISPHTVQKHRKNIIKKLGLKNFNEIVTYTLEKGII
jgi:RNA polymerase sigma factor (sigma-70 family)